MDKLVTLSGIMLLLLLMAWSPSEATAGQGCQGKHVSSQAVHQPQDRNLEESSLPILLLTFFTSEDTEGDLLRNDPVLHELGTLGYMYTR